MGQSLSNSSYKDQGKHMEKILDIHSGALDLRGQIEKFRGSASDPKYMQFCDILVMNIVLLEHIHKIGNAREQRACNVALNYYKECKEVLDSKVLDNRPKTHVPSSKKPNNTKPSRSNVKSSN